ncbi:PREDICTED: auxin-responsive protein IAA20-like isoform X2 [Ipomoea nil]|uniref:auxin-responsive protein IAA20-like isoform X2 n=1 Tax=Ipomoea nil TaxID=35883 RepID=UPI000900B315|nr:PREDICTED: auxin-responsive protein IAA20-like isoform X2 [Ipomoea nil]
MSMMDLQLGLALPRTGFELNCWEVNEANKNCGQKMKKRRRFDEASESKEESGAENDVEVIPTLPLLVWDKNPHHTNNEDRNSTNTNREDGDEEGVVGWPPINSVRRKLYHQQRHRCCEVNVENGGGGGHRRRLNNSVFVKVKMEGVGIARKIDLTAHHSYQTLTNTLIAMFGRSEEEVEAYKLTYEDKEGVWVVAGDVAWRTFIQSVHRLKVVKKRE